MKKNKNKNKTFNKDVVMPIFFCEKCNKTLGCSYENFGNMCDEEMTFEANKASLLIKELQENEK